MGMHSFLTSTFLSSGTQVEVACGDGKACGQTPGLRMLFNARAQNKIDQDETQLVGRRGKKNWRHRCLQCVRSNVCGWSWPARVRYLSAKCWAFRRTSSTNISRKRAND